MAVVVVAAGTWKNPFFPQKWQMHPLAFEDCILSSAEISLADGSSKPIEQITIGDVVLGYHQGRIVAAKVKKVLRTPDIIGYLVLRTADGRKVRLTNRHPIFDGKRFKAAKQFKVGQKAYILLNGQLKPVKIVAVERHPQEIVNVYNLDAEETGSFFVDNVSKRPLSLT
jgi:hypothetical protein